MRRMRTLLCLVGATVLSVVAMLLAPGGVPGGAFAAGAYPLGQGYWIVLEDGSVVPFGDAQFYGSPRETPLSAPIVGMAPYPTLEGYWLAASDGGVFTYGASRFHGSLGDIVLNKPIVGIAATPSGKGYWLAASDGGVFAFGDAGYFGSEGDRVLNKPIVAIAATPTGKGYWLVASDGGIFTHGDAGFFGSEGDRVLNRPIVGIAPSPSGSGYYLVASDGGLFTHGDAVFRGSRGGEPLNSPITTMMLSTSGQGYTLVARDGGVFAYGDAPFLGSVGDKRLPSPVRGAAVRPRLAASVIPFSDTDGAISRWAKNASGDWRLHLIYLSGELPSGAWVTGIEGIEVGQLETISYRRYGGACIDWVLGYDAGNGLEVKAFTCPPYDSTATELAFRPADSVPADARVMGLQVRNAASLFTPGGGPAEIDDIRVAGFTFSGPGEVRLP